MPVQNANNGKPAWQATDSATAMQNSFAEANRHATQRRESQAYVPQTKERK